MKSVVTHAPAHKAARKITPKSVASKSLGALPEWNLADLYPAMDAPAVKRDLDRGENECIEFEKAYKAGSLRSPPVPMPAPWLAEAVRRYEAIEDGAGAADLLCRPAVQRQHHRSGDRQVLRRHAGAHHRGVAAPFVLHARAQSLDDAALDRAMADPALGHYRPWLEDIRKDKPYQLEDRIEQLFHEKSVTGYSAFNRLFDETMVGLRFKVGKSAGIEPTLNLMQDPADASARLPPRRWPGRSRTTCACSR
jgi:oligoendopeptidase F